MPRDCLTAKLPALKRMVPPHWPASTVAQRAVLPLALAILAWVQLRADSRLFCRWQGWADQGHYLQAARAWAAWNLDPSQHHYPGGYSLLAAPFVHITPQQPFIIPDLVCAAASLVLFTRICRYLAPAAPWPGVLRGDALPAGCFLFATMLQRHVLELWAIPWTTTAAAPWLLLCLLAALRFDTFRRPRDAAFIGVAAGLAALFRPSDAAILLLTCGVFCLARLWAWQLPRNRIAALAIHGAAGLATGLLPALLVHLAVHGFTAGDYAAKSAGIGFEWRLIALRWVTLMINPKPLFPSGIGMVSAFPWLAPGCAGMLVLAWRGWNGHAARHRLVAGAIGLYWALYFAYRDLHAPGLWYYFNVHYFKWTFSFFVYWSVGLATAFLEPKRRHLIAAMAATALLFAWRPVFLPLRATRVTTQPETITLEAGLAPIHRAYAVPIDGKTGTLYLGRASLRVGTDSFSHATGFKLFEIPGGALLMPLRPLPPGPAVLTLDDGARFPADAVVTEGRWALAFGLPCLVAPSRVACQPRYTPSPGAR